MMDNSERRTIDLLVNEFWRLGFFTLSRRFGTFLPEPENVGKFQVDVIGRQKEKYAIGITLNREDVLRPDLIEKIIYLASRRTRLSNKSITLFLGVEEAYFKHVKELLSSIDENIRKNIRLIKIEENNFGSRNSSKPIQQLIFA